MERMVSEREARLEAALQEIGNEKNPVLRYDRSMAEVRAAIGDLKEYLQANPFAGMAEEIFYFRELAPRIYSRLFYFMKIHQVESFRQYASAARFQETLESELQGIEDFFLRHNDICRYYYQQTRYWDEQLFTRRGRADWPVDDISIVLDADFSLGSYWVSWIRANERYRGWLEAAGIA
jgi:RteC protein